MVLSLSHFPFFPLHSLWPGQSRAEQRRDMRANTQTHTSSMHPSLVLHTVITWTKHCTQIKAVFKNRGCSWEVMSQIASNNIAASAGTQLVGWRRGLDSLCAISKHHLPCFFIRKTHSPSSQWPQWKSILSLLCSHSKPLAVIRKKAECF